MYVIGLISGTSMDAIDAALVELTHAGPTLRMRVRAFAMWPYSPALRAQVVALLPPHSGSTAEVCSVNVLVGEAFANAALRLVEQAGLLIDQVDLIASHGQTVYHQVAAGAVRSTLQLGTPAVIAERTGCTVAADFRPRDIAAGGQGAPLVPYLDLLLFRHERHYRAVQNIGGIGNVTYLQPITGDRRLKIEDRGLKIEGINPVVSETLASIVYTPSPTGPAVLAFDTGPGNVLIDEAIRLLTDGARGYDRDGQMAAAGHVDQQLLDAWLNHPFFHQPPPRSTGREQFGVAEARAYVAECQARGLSAEDTIATLTALTARSIAGSYQRYCGQVDEVLVSGGGARNLTLLAMLQAALPGASVRTVDALGLDADAKEAVAFAVAGYATLHGWPNNVPAATGAAHPAVLGSITPGANYRALLAQVVAAPREPVSRLQLT
jgi:anhydro-N-acetylmuramic acid kinase